MWLGVAVDHWAVLLWTLGRGTEASPVLMLEFVVPKAVPTGGDWSGPRLTLPARIWLHGV